MRAAVLFDFGGTLDADGIPWSERFHAEFLAGGGIVSRESFDAVFRESDRLLALSPGVESLGLRAMCARQMELLDPLLPRGHAVDLVQAALRFAQSAARTAARNRSVLAALRRDYVLGIVSNFTGNLAHCLEDLGLTPFFDVVLDSSVVGFAKPDPRIFTLALERIGARAGAHVWMVGDNFDTDIRPAQALGLSGCWIAPPTRPLPPGAQRVARIAELNVLPQVLGA